MHTGSGLSALTLAKALVNENISVDITLLIKFIKLISLELLVFLKVILIILTKMIINMKK